MSNKKFKRIIIQLILLLVLSGYIDAQTSTENHKINFPSTSLTLKIIINEIEKQTDLKFAYSSEKINLKTKFNLPEKSMNLNDFMELLSSGYQISNYINGNQIVLFEKKTENFIKISGYVTDAKTGEKLIAANIYNSQFEGTTSNNYGYFTFSQPASGNTLNFSYIGYKPYTINTNSITDTFINARLEPFLLLDEVEVIGREKTLIDETNPIQTYLPYKLIDNVPTVFGEGDIMKAIQLTPGTQSGLENSNGISVRGGGPGENILLLDGVQLYHYNHLLGMISIFDNDAIKSSKIIKGGIPANYGGRTSSCIDIWLKEGNKNTYSAEFTGGFPASRIFAEGPLMKNKSSFLVSARQSIHQILPLPKSDKFDINNYQFNDLTAKINFSISKKSTIYFSYYSGYDKYFDENNYTDYLLKLYSYERNRFNWGTGIMAIRFSHIINNNLFMNMSLSNSNSYFNQLTDYENTVNNNASTTEHKTKELNSGINDKTFKINFNQTISNNNKLIYGGDFKRYYLKPNVNGFIYSNFERFYTTQAASKTQNSMAYENAFFIDNQYKANEKLLINTGIRLPVFVSDNKTFYKTEPRFSFVYHITKKASYTASATRNYQFIQLLSYTNLLLPTDLWVYSKKGTEPVKSGQITSGIHLKLNKNYSFSSEVYFKKQKNLLTFTNGPEFLMMNLGWEDKVINMDGKNYGIEFLFHKINGKINGWISYTLSHSERICTEINDGEPFSNVYDKPHVLNLVLNSKIYEGIEIGATWIYTSGMPFSFSNSSYRSAIDDYNFEIFNNENRSFTINEIENNPTTRLPDYHRLDFSLTYHNKYKFIQSIIKIGVYNLYNRHNPIYLFAENGEMYQVSIFPMLPYIQIKLKLHAGK